jgi:copper transport protein
LLHVFIWPRALLAVACLALVGIFGPASVAAHAVLLRTVPSSSQSLSQPPDKVELLFSEPIDPVFTGVRVQDSAGQAIDRGDSHVDPNDDHLLVASLQAGLPNGIYTVSWRSLSTIDVHPDGGEYPLFVGVPVSTGVGAPVTSSAGPTATPETTFGRWWFYLGASLFGGVLATWKLVLSGVLVGTCVDARAAVRRRAQRLIVLGGVLLVLGTLFTAVAQAAAAANVPLLNGLGQPLADLLLRGRFATIWWPRLGLEIASLLLIAFGGLEGLAAESALATLPAVLLTSSLTSHGAALAGEAAPGIAVDWLHIVGATAWVGGLVSLVIVWPAIRGRTGEGGLRTLTARFGRFALAASVVVVLSGVLQASLEVGSWSALIDSTYGQLVLLKVALVVGMLALAAVNELRARRSPARSWRLGIQAELALGVTVLVVAAVLSGTAPTPGPQPPPIAELRPSS